MLKNLFANCFIKQLDNSLGAGGVRALDIRLAFFMERGGGKVKLLAHLLYDYSTDKNDIILDVNLSFMWTCKPKRHGNYN